MPNESNRLWSNCDPLIAQLRARSSEWPESNSNGFTTLINAVRRSLMIKYPVDHVCVFQNYTDDQLARSLIIKERIYSTVRLYRHYNLTIETVEGSCFKVDIRQCRLCERFMPTRQQFRECSTTCICVCACAEGVSFFSRSFHPPFPLLLPCLKPAAQQSKWFFKLYNFSFYPNMAAKTRRQRNYRS